jgi:aspartate/methionine/tyrosine aminotransferase
LCNPHNPHGHICPADIIDALLQYCEEADLHFISDEIYALSTFGHINPDTAGFGHSYESPTSQFVSVLSKDLDKLGVSGSRVHMLYSISKDIGSSGLRLVRIYPSSTHGQRIGLTSFLRAFLSRNQTKH